MSSERPPLYRCIYPGCKSKFNTTGNYKRHLLGQHINPTIYTCERCYQTSPSKRKAQSHARACNDAAFQQSEDERLISPVTGLEYFTVAALASHLIQHCSASTLQSTPAHHSYSTRVHQNDLRPLATRNRWSATVPYTNSHPEWRAPAPATIMQRGGLALNQGHNSHPAIQAASETACADLNGWFAPNDALPTAPSSESTLSSSTNRGDLQNSTGNTFCSAQSLYLPGRFGLRPLSLTPWTSSMVFARDEPLTTHVHPPQVLPSQYEEHETTYLHLQ